MSDFAAEEEPDDLSWFMMQAFVFLFIVGAIGALLPLKAKDMQQNRERFLSVGNVFAGGLFLAAGFIHMLGEALEGFLAHNLPAENALLFCMLGIGVTLFVEKVALAYYIEVFGQGSAMRYVHAHSHAAGGAHDDAEDESKLKGNADGGAAKPFHMYVLTILLSLHSIIEGIALGVEQQESDAQRVLMAIAAHKLFDGFALGLSVMRGGLSGAAYVRVVVLFAFMSPLGILLGQFFTLKLEPTDNLMSCGVQSFASGSFIYVALVEILLPEFDTRQDKLVKFTVLCAGVMLMLSL